MMIEKKTTRAPAEGSEEKREDQTKYKLQQECIVVSKMGGPNVQITNRGY